MSEQPDYRSNPGYPTVPPGPPAYRRHPLDVGPLVFGLIFLGLVAVWALFEVGLVAGGDAAWALPVVLIGAGALGIVLAAARSGRAPSPEPWTVHGPATHEPTTQHLPIDDDQEQRHD